MWSKREIVAGAALAGGVVMIWRRDASPRASTLVEGIGRWFKDHVFARGARAGRPRWEITPSAVYPDAEVEPTLVEDPDAVRRWQPAAGVT
jgi:hypothetical protein